MADPDLRYAAHDDGRGVLVALELGEAPFPVRRVFTVTGVDGGADRGGHASSCREAVVLAGGRAEIEVDGVVTMLDEPGRGVLVEAGQFVRYRLPDDRSVVVVLADEAYRP